MNKSILFSILGLQLVVTGCGSLTHKKDEAAVSQVKRVAVVAFTATLPSSATIGFDANSGKLGAEAGGSLTPQSEKNIDQMFEELNKAFANNLKWQVLPADKMIVHPAYKNAYHRTMSGWQNKMPPGQGQRRFIVKDVMDFDGPRILDVDGRNALMKDLNVDAIVVANVNVYLSGTTVMGIGPRKPVTRLSFMLYRQGVEAPIWFEGGIDGDEQASVGKTAYIDEKLLSDYSLKSAKTAFSKIGTSVE